MTFLKNSLFFLFLGSQIVLAQAAPVLTRSGNNLRTGVYQDSTLTPANIGKLHKLYTVQIPGDKRGVESQPLVLPGVKGSDGVTRDLLVLSTLANDVLGVDFKDGKIIWKTYLGRPIDVTKAIDFWGINDHDGVMSTGVIDPAAKIFYCVAWVSPDGQAKNGHHELHAIDLTTGQEAKKPLSMNPLTYDPGNGLPLEKFSGQMRKQRSALLLQTIGGRKTIVFASGSVLETNGAASGWVSAADTEAWRFTGSWSSTSRYSGGGIWGAGNGVLADSKGFLYVVTGNGSFAPPTDFAESFVELKYTPPADPTKEMGKIEAVDWWSPWSDSGRTGGDPTLPYPNAPLVKISGINQPSASGILIQPVETVNQDSSHHMAMEMAPKNDARYQAYADQDLGSGGIVAIEKFNMLAGAGKDGILYSLNMNNLGKTMPQDFRNAKANCAKLLSLPIWFSFAAFRHDSQGNAVGYEDACPQDSTRLNFSYDNLTHHMHSTPVVLENSPLGTLMFNQGENGNARAWRVNPNGSLTYLANGQEVASSQSPRNRGGMPGGFLSLSANQGKNAILWSIIPDDDANRMITTGKLVAYDAQNFSRYQDGSGWMKTLWTSNFQFFHPKFNLVTISGGRVILPTYGGTVEVLGIQ